ncbi:17906_t:CDS:2, partial [Funneliformis caledonium]
DRNQRKAGSNVDNLWLGVERTLKEKNINAGTNCIQLVACEGVKISNVGDKRSLATPIKKGSNEFKQQLGIYIIYYLCLLNVTLIDFKTEDKGNTVDGSYKRRRTEDEDHEDLEHPNSENFLNNEKSTDNDDELERHAEETIQYDGKIWIVGNTKINVRDALTKWQKRKDKPRTDLAFYDIIDITPGSNSDFIRSLPNDAIHEMKQFGSSEQLVVADNVRELIVKLIKADDFRKVVDENYIETRKNDTLRFVWDFANHLAESFERDDDLTDFDLSELAYREIFLAPVIQYSVYPCSGEEHLFASSEELNLKKTDKESRVVGNKVDIIWSLKSTDLEITVGEVSGPPNQRDHPHFFGDKLKIAKMLKVIINRIVRKHDGTGVKLCSLKLYGLQIYNNEAIVYELSVAFQGLYIFRELLRSKLPTNKIEVALMSRSIPALLKFRELLEQSLKGLKDYIMDAYIMSIDSGESANQFITFTKPDKETTNLI